MTELTYTVTIDGEPWSDAQLRRVEYERTLHVLHELKDLGVPVTDAGRGLSHVDLNWLEPERAMAVSLAARDALGEEGFLGAYRVVLADSERRFKTWATDYDPRQARTGTTVIEGHGVGFRETMAVLGGASNQHDSLSVNPEHFAVVGAIASGQRGSETFGMFGEPVYVHGSASDEVPAGLPVRKDPSFPLTVFGEMATKSDDTNLHVGALHQVRPTTDGFVIRSTFTCPGKAPQAIADGHKIHFALEIVNSMRVAHAKQRHAAA